MLDLDTLIKQLGNSRNDNVVEADAIFAGASGSNASVKFVLTFPPEFHIHGGDEDRLSPLAYEFVSNFCIAQVITNTDA